MISVDKELIRMVVNAAHSLRLKKWESNDRNICRTEVVNLELALCFLFYRSPNSKAAKREGNKGD